MSAHLDCSPCTPARLPILKITKPRPKLACIVFGHDPEVIPAKVTVHCSHPPDILTCCACVRCGQILAQESHPMSMDDALEIEAFCRRTRR